MAIPNAQQHYSLKWNNYLKHITFAFDFLRCSNDLVDVTLCCDGKKIKCHKVLLSACSGYFKEIFKDNPHPHPVIVFKFIKFDDLNAIIEFIYQGRVNVQQDALQSFLQTAELLAVHGLTSAEKSNSKIKTTEEHKYVEETKSHKNDKLTQTAYIDFSHTNQSNTSKKRKIEYTDSEEEEDDVVFYKPHSDTKIETIDIKTEMIETPTKTNVPDFVEYSVENERKPKVLNSEVIRVSKISSLTAAATHRFCTDQYESSINSKQNQEILTAQELISTSEVRQNPSDIMTSENINSETADNATETQTLQQIEPIDLFCNICKRQLQSIYAFRRHNASKHGQKSEKYNCKSCEKSFKTKWSLSTHNSRFHRNKKKQNIKMNFSI